MLQRHQNTHGLYPSLQKLELGEIGKLRSLSEFPINSQGAKTFWRVTQSTSIPLKHNILPW